jgi:hypothetical protein
MLTQRNARNLVLVSLALMICFACYSVYAISFFNYSNSTAAEQTHVASLVQSLTPPVTGTPQPPTVIPLITPALTPQSSASATATPARLVPPTPTGTLTATPIRVVPQACSFAAGGSFARFLSDTTVASRLGCPTEAEATIESAVELFQGGFMLWRGASNRLFAVYNEGKWGAYPKGDYDWFREGIDPEYSCGTKASPPSPRRGFSKVWCNNPEVRNTLGNALEYEQGYCMGNQCDSFQDFQGGMMYRSVKFAGVYVFYIDGTWQKK